MSALKCEGRLAMSILSTVMTAMWMQPVTCTVSGWYYYKLSPGSELLIWTLQNLSLLIKWWGLTEPLSFYISCSLWTSHVYTNEQFISSIQAKLLTKGGNISEFADIRLNGRYSIQAFELVFKLALSCTSHKHQRPSMEQVVTRLEKALEISTRENETYHVSVLLPENFR